MFRWLLILTMALLPWHGWAGASLAATVPQQAASAVLATAADDGTHHPGQASADCLDGETVAAEHHAAGAADGGCPGCSMCHSCSPTGLPALIGVTQADPAAPLRPAGAASRFASAERLRGLKPPIS